MISWLSLAGIAFGTAAIIIVLSVFNGLEDLNRSLFKSYDADLTILPKKGKSFDPAIVARLPLNKLPGVDYVNATVQDNALLRYNDLQCVATVKGVDSYFLKNEAFKKSIVEGQCQLSVDSSYGAVIGLGIQQNLLISTENAFSPIEFWYPRKNSNLILATEDSFNKGFAYPTGVFSIEQAYDQIVIVPLALAQALFERENQLSSLEISLKPNADIQELKTNIAKSLPASLKILDSDEQHASLLSAIKIEKLFVFMALICITAIAALNLFFSLTMLVIEKKKDILTLKSLGANESLIKKIFQNTGYIISIIGLLAGLCIGFAFCYAQQQYGFLKMGMVSALVDAYPVRMSVSDFLATAIGILLISTLIIQFPAKKAANF